MSGSKIRLKLALLGGVLLLAALLWLRSSYGPEADETGADVGVAPAGPVSSLSWLAGCWKHEESGYRRDEQWMRPDGGTMIGMSRTVAAGETVEWEHIRIETRDGKLAYVANPAGQAEAAFLQAELTDSSVVFEASEHDFPQRIIYQRMSPGSIHAWIEGDVDGVTRVVEFPMARTRCP